MMDGPGPHQADVLPTAAHPFHALRTFTAAIRSTLLATSPLWTALPSAWSLKVYPPAVTVPPFGRAALEWASIRGRTRIAEARGYLRQPTARCGSPFLTTTLLL